MLYNYVKEVGTTFEFLKDEGIEYNGVIYNPQFLDASSVEQLAVFGVHRTILLQPPINASTKDGTYYFNLRSDGVVEYRPNYTLYTDQEIMAQTVQRFTDMTTAYIESKVQAYNLANGLAFKDIDAFTKYVVTPTSTHNAIANQFISYADRIWNAARAYQSTATSIPTDAEFQTVLDSVVF